MYMSCQLVFSYGFHHRGRMRTYVLRCTKNCPIFPEYVIVEQNGYLFYSDVTLRAHEWDRDREVNRHLRAVPSNS